MLIFKAGKCRPQTKVKSAGGQLSLNDPSEKQVLPVGYQELLKGRSFEVRVLLDREVTGGVKDVFSDVVCDEKNYYRSVAFSA